MAPWDSIRLFPPLALPSPFSLSSLRLISSDDDVIRPSHVALNCSIIFQSLSQPITCYRKHPYRLGTYARHYVWHLRESSPVDPTGKYARLLFPRSFYNRQFCPRDITIQSLFREYNPVCLSFCLLAFVASCRRRPLGKMGRYVTSCRYNFL